MAPSDEYPNRVPWTAQQAFRGVLFTLIPWIVFTLLENATGGSSTSNQPVTRAEDVAGAFLAFVLTAIIEGIFLIAPYYYAKRTLADIQTGVRAIFRALGLRGFRPGKTLLMVAGLLVLIILSNFVYSYATQALKLNIQTNDNVLLQEGASQPLTVYGLLLGSVILAPLCEEIFFRGFLLTGILRELSPLWSIVISSALFAIAHVDFGDLLPLFAIGLALGFIRWKSGSTWAGIILHVSNNLLASLLIILQLQHVNIPF